ncbi:MAG: hypothetical protein A2Z88_04005 [Omnitrophica WOR_2 bacterium GWA2_47_8]|nr:MAG: hypothetical protein A2Z88_04005 [Omnitrophica WOR_2 bacterium GWA2_47_8]
MGRNFLRLLLTVWAVYAFCSAGCAWFKRKPAPAKAEPPSSESRDEEFQTLNRARLKEGGNLLIVPFSAGVNVEATDELEAVSLYIVKGIGETLMAGNGPLKVLTEGDLNQADFVFQGHITKLGTTHSLTEILKPKSLYLSVKGEMLEQKTGKVLFYFSRNIFGAEGKDDFKTLGDELGKGVANYLMEDLKD